MPNNIVKSFAQKTGKSESEVEDLWNQAKAKADNKEGLEKDSDSYYAYITAILKNMLSINESIKIGDKIKITSPYKSPSYGKRGYLFADVLSISNHSAKIKVYAATYDDDIPKKDGIMTIPIESLPKRPFTENINMKKNDERRALTRKFVQKVMDGQKFDAAVELKEVIRLSKEIRYDNVAATVEI